MADRDYRAVDDHDHGQRDESVGRIDIEAVGEQLQQ